MSNSQLTVAQALNWAKQQFTIHGVTDDGEFNSASIDSKLLLCATLQCEVIYLHTWPDKTLDTQQHKQFQEFVAKRMLGHPVAHLIGYRDFWSLRLKVSPATLIPRADTERLIEVALELPISDTASVLDLGTGTGAIALSLASENPGWQVLGVDQSLDAVKLAKENAQLNQLTSVDFIQSDWFSAISLQEFELIVSNPPYIESSSQYLQQGDVRFEPSSALTSGENGLLDIKHIIQKSKLFLKTNGWLVIEHGYQQAKEVANIFKHHHFVNVQTAIDLGGQARVTFAQKT